MVTLLNSPRLTAFGQFDYCELTVAKARELVAGGCRSVIGHAATAELLAELLGVPVACTPGVQYEQQVGEQAIVFELKQRQAGIRELDQEDLKRIGYRLGLLTRRA